MKDFFFYLYIGVYVALACVIVYIASGEKRVILFGFTRKQSNLIYVLFLSLIMGILACCRPMIVADTQNYYEFFLQEQDWKGLFRNGFFPGRRFNNMETLFALLVWGLKDAGFSFRAILFFFGFVNTFLFLFGAWKIAERYFGEKTDIIHLIALYFSMFGLLYSCIAIRGGLSLGLSLCAIALLVNKKWLPGILVLYLAVLSHVMALLSIPAFLLFMITMRAKKPCSTKLILCVFFLCFFVLFFNLGSFFIETLAAFGLSLFSRWNISSMTKYLSEILDKNVSIKCWILVISSFILLFILAKKTDQYKKLPYLVLVGALILSFLYPIRSISRAADYFYIFLLPMAAAYQKKKLSVFQRLCVTFGVNALYLVVMSYIASIY